MTDAYYEEVRGVLAALLRWQRLDLVMLGVILFSVTLALQILRDDLRSGDWSDARVMGFFLLLNAWNAHRWWASWNTQRALIRQLRTILTRAPESVS